MKDNQHLYRPFPGENPQLLKRDTLKAHVFCKCSICPLTQQKQVPQVYQDFEIYQLKKAADPLDKQKSDLAIFLNQLHKNGALLPQLPLLDTIILNNKGELDYFVTYQKNKVIFGKSLPSIKNFVEQKKSKNDLQYQKKKYMRKNFGFSFTQLDHQSEKLIKKFEHNVQFISPLLNRTIIIKVKQKAEQEILNMTEFKNLFEKVKSKTHQLSQIQYMQIFPIMSGQQQYSYQKQIKYSRQKQVNKENYKTAQHFFSSWYQKNQTQQKMQHEVIQKLKAQQEQLLRYYTYKIFLFFEHMTKIRIESAIVYYITIDEGTNFFLKTLSDVRAKKLLPIQQVKGHLPNKKQIDQQDYIVLKDEMNYLFSQYQQQYSRLDDERTQVQSQLSADKQYSNMVYRTITKIHDKDLHQVLSSPSKKYKEKFLKLK